MQDCESGTRSELNTEIRKTEKNIFNILINPNIKPVDSLKVRTGSG